MVNILCVEETKYMPEKSNQVTIVHYSNEWRDKLMIFLKQEYPHRKEQYLEFCLDYLDKSPVEAKEKAVVALMNSKIVGCYTVLPLRMINNSGIEDLYIQVNMMVSPNYRGLGISSFLYYYLDYYPNWMVTGFTEVAWKIVPKKVKSFNPIDPIYVYLMFNSWLPVTALKRMHIIKKTNGLRPFPDNASFSNFTLKKARMVEDLFFPSAGRWHECNAEIVRDREYIDERFFKHYRSKEYVVYSLCKNKQPIGYFVVRPTEYKGFQMLSLVDFRYVNSSSWGDVLKAVAYIANKTHYGMVIVLTSLKLPRISLFPWVVRTTKELPCATGVESLAQQRDILFTSADSDLDYVYYK